MLKTRLITAVLIAIVVLTLLFTTKASIFALLSALIVLAIGGWEAARLAGLKSGWACWTTGACLMMIGLVLGSVFGLIDLSVINLVETTIPLPPLLIWPGIMWLALLCWLAQPGWCGRPGAGPLVFKLTILSSILLSAWLSLSWLHSRSPWLVVMLIIIIAAADIGAYFTGRKVGGPKLAPRISPGKTWSGVAGGVLATVVVTSLAALVVPMAPFSALLAGGLAMLLAWISIGGDLFMSLLKRQQGIKDSSNLLPGHGGILDRLDSLGAALPFFALAVAYLGNPA